MNNTKTYTCEICKTESTARTIAVVAKDRGTHTAVFGHTEYVCQACKEKYSLLTENELAADTVLAE